MGMGRVRAEKLHYQVSGVTHFEAYHPFPLPPSPPCGEGGIELRGILGGEAAQNTPFKGFPRPQSGAGARGWGHSVVQLRNSCK